MTLNLNKLPWYAQLGVVAVLAGAGAFVFWNFYARDVQTGIDSRRTELASLQAELNRGAVIAKRLPQFRQEVAGLEAQLDRLRAVLPEEKDVSDLLRRIQAMATESRLVIRGFTPQAVANKQLYAEWPIGLQVEGNYHNVGGFLERISKFPRIINVTAIKIRAKDQPSNAMTVSVDCTATTFVMTEPKTPAGPTPPVAAAPGRTE